MAAAIYWLTAWGADVIVDDIMDLAEPMFMDGLAAQAVDAAVANGVQYFSAAMNLADYSYETTFDDSGIYFEPGAFAPSGVFQFRGGIAHDFDPGPGIDVFQRVTFERGEHLRISFQWDEPFASVTGGNGAANEVDIYALDEDLTTVEQAAWNAQNMGGDPVELMTLSPPWPPGQETATYNIMIVWRDGESPPSRIKYVNFGNPPDWEYATHSSTTYGHANAAGALAVGAAFYGDTPEFGIAPPVAAGYNSRGGTDILFDTAGNRLSTPEHRVKPGVVAPDGVNTTFFGHPDIEYDPDDFPNFFGTSAAAPHVAGLAALILEAEPQATAAEIYSALEFTALDIVTKRVRLQQGNVFIGYGFDDFSGFGLVDAVAAADLVTQGDVIIDANLDPAPGDQADDGNPDSFLLVRSGDYIYIDVNGSALAPLHVKLVNSITLNGSGDDDLLSIEPLGPPGGGGQGQGGGAAGSSQAGPAPLAPAEPLARLTVGADGVVIEANGAALTGYVLNSKRGIFRGGPAHNLGAFREDEDARISGGLGFVLSGSHFLGDVIAEALTGVDLAEDVTFTYTTVRQPGIHEGAVVLAPDGETFAWLYEFEQTRTQGPSSDGRDPIAAAVDQLLATVGV